jgi:hypothetical protein
MFPPAFIGVTRAAKTPRKAPLVVFFDFVFMVDDQWSFEKLRWRSNPQKRRRECRQTTTASRWF